MRRIWILASLVTVIAISGCGSSPATNYGMTDYGVPPPSLTTGDSVQTLIVVNFLFWGCVLSGAGEQSRPLPDDNLVPLGPN